MHSGSRMMHQAHWSCEVIAWMWIDWLDLPKLTTLRTNGYCNTFRYPRHITLESDSHPLWMMFRHAPSHRCGSSKGIQLQESRHNPRKHSLHPSLTNRHRGSSRILQLITEKHVTPPLCATHPQHPLPIHFRAHSAAFERALSLCTNTEIMTIRIWNDGNPIRIVETTSNDHSLHIAWNPHHSSFQITHIASPFKWEPSLNNWKWQPKHQSSHTTAYLAILSPIITSKYQFHPSIPMNDAAQIAVAVASYLHQIAQSNKDYPHSQPHPQITLPHPWKPHPVTPHH